jgi:hypothetical protein
MIARPYVNAQYIIIIDCGYCDDDGVDDDDGGGDDDDDDDDAL